jgi:hypothetical protein
MAALALLALVIWSVAELIEAPFFARVAADRATLAAAAARGTGVSAARQDGDLRAEEVRLERFTNAATWRLEDSSPELLSAQLQRQIEAAAAQSGASVASSRTVPAQMQGSLTRVELDFDVQASLPSLQTLLHGIEAARPPIFIDRLTVQRPETGAQNDLAVSLHVSIYAAPARSTGGVL